MIGLIGGIDVLLICAFTEFLLLHRCYYYTELLIQNQSANFTEAVNH